MLVVLNIVKGAFPEGSLDNIQVPSYQHVSRGKGEVTQAASVNNYKVRIIIILILIA
jgi:hypothetical protein